MKETIDYINVPSKYFFIRFQFNFILIPQIALIPEYAIDTQENKIKNIHMERAFGLSLQLF